MSRLERLKLSMALAKATAIKESRLTFRPGPVMMTAVAGCAVLSAQPPETVTFVLVPFVVLIMPSSLSRTRPSALSTPVAGASAVT